MIIFGCLFGDSKIQSDFTLADAITATLEKALLHQYKHR
jgi:hypothetical protein